jgi:hypothetical protein
MAKDIKNENTRMDQFVDQVYKTHTEREVRKTALKDIGMPCILSDDLVPVEGF